MFKVFSRGWKYFIAALSGKLDEVSDPKIQIEQAIQEAQEQHRLLSQQASAVIGQKHQLEMRLTRQLADVEKLQSSARQAIIMADQARANGDVAKAEQYEATATTFATQLVTAESSLEDMKSMHAQAVAAADSAKDAVEANAMRLQQKMAEKSQLLTQLESAKMQERVTATLDSMSVTADQSTPSFDQIREKIEARHARAKGSAELAANSVEGRMMEVQKATLEAGGSARLEQIRASLGQPAATPIANAPAAEAPQRATEGPASA